jgi:hypothetical protein
MSNTTNIIIAEHCITDTEIMDALPFERTDTIINRETVYRLPKNHHLYALWTIYYKDGQGYKSTITGLLLHSWDISGNRFTWQDEGRDLDSTEYKPTIIDCLRWTLVFFDMRWHVIAPTVVTPNTTYTIVYEKDPRKNHKVQDHYMIPDQQEWLCALIDAQDVLTLALNAEKEPDPWLPNEVDYEEEYIDQAWEEFYHNLDTEDEDWIY